MKTMQAWNDNGGDFSKYVQPKDEIDSDMYFYFLECLPPRIMKSYGFLVGEPYTHNSEGKAVYDSFYQSLDGKRFYYGGPKTEKQFMDQTDPIWTL